MKELGTVKRLKETAGKMMPPCSNELALTWALKLEPLRPILLTKVE